MMNIPAENTFELKDANLEDLEEMFTWLRLRFTVLIRKLERSTGILGLEGFFQGVFWEILRPHAMKLNVPFDRLVIDLDQDDQDALRQLVKL